MPRVCENQWSRVYRRRPGREPRPLETGQQLPSGNRPRTAVCSGAEGQSQAHGFTLAKLISDEENGETEQATRANTEGPGGDTGRGQRRGPRGSCGLARGAPARSAARPHSAPHRPVPPPCPRPEAPGPQEAPPPPAAPARVDPGPRASSAACTPERAGGPVGREERRLRRASRLTYLRPPQARVRRARDNGASAVNTPRVSIRGCLLPTLARLRDRGGETDGPERGLCRPCVPCVRAQDAEGRGAPAGRTGEDLATFAARSGSDSGRRRGVIGRQGPSRKRSVWEALAFRISAQGICMGRDSGCTGPTEDSPGGTASKLVHGAFRCPDGEPGSRGAPSANLYPFYPRGRRDAGG